MHKFAVSCCHLHLNCLQLIVIVLVNVSNLFPVSLHQILEQLGVLGFFEFKLKSESLVLTRQLVDFPLILAIALAELFRILILFSLDFALHFQDQVAPGFLFLVELLFPLLIAGCCLGLPLLALLRAVGHLLLQAFICLLVSLVHFFVSLGKDVELFGQTLALDVGLLNDHL